MENGIDHVVVTPVDLLTFRVGRFDLATKRVVFDRSVTATKIRPDLLSHVELFCRSFLLRLCFRIWSSLRSWIFEHFWVVL